MTTNILLIDDDEDDYIITREIIEEIRGRYYLLNWVNNAEEAISAILKDEHNIYLVDYR